MNNDTQLFSCFSNHLAYSLNGVRGKAAAVSSSYTSQFRLCSCNIFQISVLPIFTYINDIPMNDCPQIGGFSILIAV